MAEDTAKSKFGINQTGLKFINDCKERKSDYNRYIVRTYKGCPIPTILWNVLTLVAYISGIMGLTTLCYVFFPEEDTNPKFVKKVSAVGLPIFIFCLIARRFVDKLGRKQLKERNLDKQ